MDMPEITIEELLRWLTDTEEEDNPLFIHGPSGVGKTEVLEQHRRALAAKRGLDFHLVGQPHTMQDPERTYGFLDLRVALMDALDAKGAPLLDREAGVTTFLPPSLLPNAERHGYTGTLVLDELPQGYPMVTNSLTSLIQERRVGDSYVFPKGWTIVAMGNRKEDHCNTSKLGAQVYNRFTHVTLLPSVAAFAAYRLKKGSDGALAGFLRALPHFIHNYKRDDITFCSPRSLERADELYAKITDDRDYREARIAGWCGVDFARQFEGYLAIRAQLASWQEIKSEPTTAHVPELTDEHGTATLYALVGIVHRNVDAESIEAAVTYISRFPDGFQMCFFLDVQASKKHLMDTTVVSRWRAEHHDIAI